MESGSYGRGACPGAERRHPARDPEGIVHYNYDILASKRLAGPHRGPDSCRSTSARYGHPAAGRDDLGARPGPTPSRSRTGVGKIFAQVEKFELDAVVASAARHAGRGQEAPREGPALRRGPEDDRQRLSGTDYTFGLRHRRVGRGRALDRLHTTAEALTGPWSSSHGPHAGWIAVEGGSPEGRHHPHSRVPLRFRRDLRPRSRAAASAARC